MSLEPSWNARSNVILDLKGCSKAVLSFVVGHGKSPWFSRCSVLRVVGVGWRGLVSWVVDGGFFLD